MTTYATALAQCGLDVPPHLPGEEEVPLLAGPQAQGDILVLPSTEPIAVLWKKIPPEGITVIRSDLTHNSHTLIPGQRSPGTQWAVSMSGVRLGYVKVPVGQSALLVHSEEHGANGLAPGCYALHRKRAAEIAPPPPPRPVYHRREERDRNRFIED